MDFFRMSVSRLAKGMQKGVVIVDGVETTIPLFESLLENPDFQKADYDIHWLENFLKKQK